MDLGYGVKVELRDIADKLDAGSEIKRGLHSYGWACGLSNWRNCSAIY